MDPATTAAIIKGIAILGSGQMIRSAQQKQAQIGRELTGLGEALDIERGGYSQAQQQSGLALKDYIDSLRGSLGG